MKRTLCAALLAGATGLGCTVIAFGYWIDSIQVKTDVTVLYPVEIAVVQSEKIPLPEEIPPEKAPPESVPADDTDVKPPPQDEAGSAPEKVTDPADAQTPSGEKSDGEPAEKPAPAAPAEPASPADPGAQADSPTGSDKNTSTDSPAEPTGGTDSGPAADAGGEASGESAPDAGTDGDAQEGDSD